MTNESAIESTFTNQDGEYQLDELDTGQYIIEFAPYSSSPYAPEWYDNQPSFDDAAPVSVTDGMTAISMQLSKLGRRSVDK